MKSNRTIGTLLILIATVLGGCSSSSAQQNANAPAAPYGSGPSSYGAIESIRATHAENDNTGTGIVIGGLIGGLFGNQLGSGNGKAVTTVAGMVGGAMIGNALGKNASSQQEMYEIGVRLDSGNTTTVMQNNIYEMNIGNRVRVAGGRVYRY